MAQDKRGQPLGVGSVQVKGQGQRHGTAATWAVRFECFGWRVGFIHSFNRYGFRFRQYWQKCYA